MSATKPDRPLRADARENRETLLRVASERFAAGGPDVPLEPIAREAGVGIGTLYRHFPTREALIEAVYRNEVDQLCSAADTLLADRAPADALAEWMTRFVAYAATKRGLSGALKSIAASDACLFASTRERMSQAIGKLLDAGILAGEIRPDVTVEDVFTSMNAIWTIDGDGDQWAARALRVRALLMDGLRFGAVAPAGFTR